LHVIVIIIEIEHTTLKFKCKTNNYSYYTNSI